MLTGRFGNTSGRPYIEARLYLPRLNVATNLSLLVDTGADSCVLMPADALRLGVDYSTLSNASSVQGVGGATQMYLEDGVLVFEAASPPRQLYVYNIKVLVASPSPDLMRTPSLVGREVLDRWKMAYAPRQHTLTFDVLDCDLAIPLAATSVGVGLPPALAE